MKTINLSKLDFKYKGYIDCSVEDKDYKSIQTGF